MMFPKRNNATPSTACKAEGDSTLHTLIGQRTYTHVGRGDDERMMMKLAHVGFGGRAPPRPNRVGRTGPLAALRRRREEQGRIRESHEETVRFMYDGSEEGDSTRRVVACLFFYQISTAIRRAL